MTRVHLPTTRNGIFILFVAGLFVLLLLYGFGMTVVILVSDSYGIKTRMISAFTAMFTGVLGLGSGYLLGSAYPVKEDKE